MEKKKWSLFGGILLAVCLLSGCGSQKQSNASSSAAKPVAAPIEKSAEDRTSSDKRSSSSAEEKEVTEQSNMKQEMDFDQIKQGNYSSLLGEWEEIAVSLNRHDGNGNIWVASKGETISISQNKISNESMTLQGGIINDGESKTVSFSPIFPFFETPAIIATSVKRIGITTSEVNGDNFFFMMTYMKTTIIA